MKHFTKIMSAAVLTAATLSFPGCQDYDAGFDAAEIKYKTEFSKIFGKIDPNQDWNLATRAAVTVSTNTSSNVKVYALTDGKYRLVADYSEVSGTKTLGFDVREDVSDLMVTDGCTAVKAKVGESVSFGGTRAGHYGTTGDVKVTEINDPTQWFVFDLAESEKYQQKLPENKDNLGKVTQNFTFISNGEFTVYPIYWQTDNTDDIGVYFTDATGYHEIPIYTNKSGDELQYQEMTGHDPANDSSHPGLSVGDECPYHSGKKIIYLNHEGHKGSYYIYCEGNAHWEDVGDLQKANSKFTPLTTMEEGWGTYVKYYRSKGVKVSIPAGTLFGMYIKPSNGVKQYSQQEKNSSIYSTAPTKDVVAATFTLPSTSNSEEDDMYLCFEDWQTSSCDKDLNDIVFRFYGSTPTVVDNDPDAWIICAEDLGNTFDIDYNDVVVEVKHVSGKTTTMVSPIAAGGTLASYIYFNDATEGEKCLGEIHELLGQSNNVSGSYTPINVNGTVNTAIIKDFTFNVSESWSIASSTVGDESFSTDAAMGGFSVRVVPAGTQASQNAAVGGQKIQNSTALGDDNVPYVFCVPRNYTRTENGKTIDAWFRWSNEMKSLYPLSGYGSGTYSTSGHAFAEWVANKNNAKDWYQYPTDLDNTTGIYYVTTTNNPPSVDPENPDPENPVTYTINASIASECEGMGTVSGAGSFEEGSSTSLTATPISGYEFEKWVVGAEEFTTNPLEITVSGEASYTAYFKASSIECTFSNIGETYIDSWYMSSWNSSITLPSTDLTGKNLVIKLEKSTNTDILYGGFAGTGTKSCGSTADEFIIEDFSNFTDGIVYVSCYQENKVESAKIVNK